VNDWSPPSRRAVLATCLTGVTAGCVGPFSNGPDCTLTLHEKFDHDAVRSTDLGYTSNNSAEGGDCGRMGAEVCFQVELWIDPAVVDRIQVQTPSGDVLASWDGDGEADGPGGSASDTADGTETDQAGTATTELDAGTGTSGEPPSVYFQLAVLSDGETTTREIVVFGDDTELTRGRFTLDC